MARAGLKSLPKALGLVKVIGCARGRNLCLSSANPMFCLNGQILFLGVDEKGGKAFQEPSK